MNKCFRHLLPAAWLVAALLCAETRAAESNAPAGATNSEPVIPVPTKANTNLPVLTKISQIRSMSPLEASRGYPVRVIGTITYYSADTWKQFVQDKSSGIYFSLPPTNSDQFKAGQKVQIDGYSGPGNYAPILYTTDVTLLGDGTYPLEKTSTVKSLITGSEDSQWVTIRGVVRNQAVSRNATVLTIWTADGIIKASVPDAKNAPAPRDFLDAAVEVRGVCSTSFNRRRQLQGVELHIPNWTQVETHEIGPTDAFTLAVQPISALLEFHAGTSGLHRSRICGVVTLCRADGACFVQDATGGILIEPKEPSFLAHVGESVEAIGFSEVTGPVPVLQDAVVRKTKSLPAIEVKTLTQESRLDEASHAMLVQLDGRVISSSQRSGGQFLTVDFAQSLTDAMLEGRTNGTLSKLVPGSVVRLTGVYIAQFDDNRTIRSFRLLLRSADDVVIISRPPWWTLRNALWVVTGCIVVLLGALMWVNLLRRQVRRRTHELSAEVETRKRAQAELEEKQAALKKEIEDRLQAEKKLKETHKQLLDISRQAGMAEVATGVLHNVGNVLNSVNVSSICVADGIRKSRVSNLSKAAALLRSHETDLGEFLTQNPKGKQLPVYLAQLADHLASEQETALKELNELQKNIEHIREIVSMQQNLATYSGMTEILDATELVEDALRMNELSLARHDIQVVKEFGPVPSLNAEKHKVLQILVNLIRNAKQACNEGAPSEKRVTIRVTHSSDRVRIAVADNGVGIQTQHLTRIFNHGFTTKKDGHGFGLHTGALAAKELGGTLIAQSDGPGSGATFILELPCGKN